MQPMLREQSLTNTFIYFPGNTRVDLYPMSASSPELKVFDVHSVNHSPWLWWLTVSFLRLQVERFEIEHRPSNCWVCGRLVVSSLISYISSELSRKNVVNLSH
jgi:hypothetical protein